MCNCEWKNNLSYNHPQRKKIHSETLDHLYKLGFRVPAVIQLVLLLNIS